MTLSSNTDKGLTCFHLRRRNISGLSNPAFSDERKLSTICSALITLFSCETYNRLMVFHVKHIKKSRGRDFYTASASSLFPFRVNSDSDYFDINLFILFQYQRCLCRHTCFSRIDSRCLLNFANDNQASLARIVRK